MIRFLRTLLSLFALLAIALAAPFAAASDARTKPLVLALIVTNNHSLGLARPDLRYADDDGAKYHALFRMMTEEANALLLTSMDHDTELLFPELRDHVRPPTKAELLAAARVLGERARAAVQEHRPVEFYFVFAGHGDVDRGSGFIELADTRFGADDLESLLRSIPATHAHVILDSCNAFFVINARKPGGTHFPTAEDAARTLSERLPTVGVFLSTSAASEVFEWSELQSGIFSHAVRSGLTGAADANGDGAISYEELRAYVTVATSALKNPAHRPQIFARGPAGVNALPILDLTGADAVMLDVEGPRRRRLTVRDADDLPWIDIHKEESFAVHLRLPKHVAAGAVVQETDASLAGNKTIARYALGAGDADRTVALSSLTTTPADSSARGAGEIFRALFAAPFGPKALAAFETSDAARTPQAYGVSDEDEARMRLLLSQVSDSDRTQRLVAGTVLLGTGVAFGAVGTGLVLDANDTALSSPSLSRAIGWSSIGTGALMAGVGAFVLALPTSGETLYDDYRTGLRLHPENPQLIVADMDRRLEEIARKDHNDRIVTRWLAVSLAGIGAAGLLVSTAHDRAPSNSTGVYSVYGFGVLLLASGSLFGQSYIPTARERVWSLWSQDPGLTQRVLQPSVSPVRGGATIGLTGTF